MTNNSQHILIVEDNDGLSELLKLEFETLGYPCFNAFTAQKALTWLDHNTPLLMVLDYTLPDMTGKDFIGILKEKGQIPPFIITTGNSDLATAIDMMKLGAREYVVKDLHFMQLIPIVFKKTISELERESQLNYTQLALNAAHNLNQRIIESIQQGLVVYNTDHQIILWNGYMEKLTGLSSEYMCGRKPTEEFDFLNTQNFSENLTNALNGVNNPTREFCISLNKLQTNIWLSATITPLFDALGMVIGAISIVTNITPSKQAEMALKESEERFKALHNASFGGITIHDKGLILECNQGLCEITGYTYNELIGMNGLLLIAEPNRQMVQQKIQEGYELPYEAMGERKNGEVYPIRLEGRNIPYKGKIVRTVEFRDITEQKLAEKALKESEERFKALHNASFGGIGIHDKGQLLECNQGLCDMTGYTYNELIGMNGLLLIAEPDRQMVQQKIQEGYELPYEALAVRKNGEVYPIRLEGRNIPYKGKMVRTVEFRDITEQKLAEKALAHSHQLMKYIIEHSQTGVAVFDCNLNYIYVSQRYLKDLDLEYDDIIGRHHYEVFPSLPQNLRKVHQNALNGEIFKAECETYIDEKGKEHWAHWECRPWFQSDGSIGGIIVYIEFITDRVNGEIKLRESEARNKAIVALLPDIILRIDNQFTIVDYEASNQVTLPISGQNIIGQQVTNLLSAELAELTRSKITQTLTTKQLQVYEFQIKLNHGKRWFEARMIPYSNSEVMCIIRDIQNSKETEHNLLINEQRLVKAQQMARVGNWELNIETNQMWASNTTFEIFGLPHQNNHCPLADMLHLVTEKHLPEVNKALFELIHQNIPYNLTYQIHKADTNKIRYIHSKAELKFNAQHHPESVVGVIQDVTQQKELENDLRVLSSAIEQNPATIVITNPAGAIEYVNPIFTKITGYTASEARGKNPRVLKSGQTPPAEYANLWNTIKDGKVWKGEFVNKKKNGELYWESASISPVLDDNGNIIHFVAVKEDITERKMLERKLLTAMIEGEEKERTRFSQELHDGLGPLLSGIKLYFQWLAETDASDKRNIIIKKGNQNIEEALQTLREISNNLSPRTLSAFGITTALKNYIDGINQLNQVAIDFSSNIENRFNKSYELSLYRIAMELINNSLKHSGATKITLSLQFNTTNNQLILNYSDNGKGFDPNHQSDTKQGNGMLNIQNRAAIMNGVVNFTSEPNKGVTVSLFIQL